MKNEIVGYEPLHVHSSYSLLDGFGEISEYAAYWKGHGDYLCVTDHGMLAAPPNQIKYCKASNKKDDSYKNKSLKPIFGIEFYVNPLQIEYSSENELQKYLDSLNPKELKLMRRRGFHLLALAYNLTGYSNLVTLSSLAWNKGFYYKPRVNHEQLLKYKEGIIFTSCCYASEIGQAFENGGEEAGYQMIEKYISMFGKEYFYLEIMLLDFVKQKPYDLFIIKAADKYGLKIILTNDCHYLSPGDSQFQRLMLMVQTKNTIKEIQKKMTDDNYKDFFELQDSNLWMKTEEELNEKWAKDYQEIDYDIFKQAKMNTVEIARKAGNVQLDTSMKLPKLDNDDDKLQDLMIQGFKERGLPTTREYLNRLKEEYNLICHKEFSSYFLIQKQIMDEAIRVCPEILGWGDGSDAYGPGRGCGHYNNLLFMPNGKVKKLGEAKLGDLVYSASGKERKILNLFEYPCDEELINIKTYYGFNQGESFTSDHKILCEKKRIDHKFDHYSEENKKKVKLTLEPTGDMNWIPVDQIEVGDWLFIPRFDIKEGVPEIIDLAKYGENLDITENKISYTNNYKKYKINRFIQWNEDFATFIGMFCGNGFFITNAPNRVSLCTHSENTDVFEFCRHMFEDEFGLCMRRYYSKTKKLVQFHSTNLLLKKLMKELFCDYKLTAQTKHVPDVVFNLPKKLKLAFLKGFFLTDGGLDKNKIKFTTSSVRMAHEVRHICLSIDIPASINLYNRYDKRSDTRNVEYSINIPHIKGLSENNYQKSYRYRIKDNGYLVQVREITKVSSGGKVYDIEVENESNYLTSSFIAHNSNLGSLICYVLGITDVDPVEHGLLFSRFLSEARGGKSISLEFENLDPI